MCKFHKIQKLLLLVVIGCFAPQGVWSQSDNIQSSVDNIFSEMMMNLFSTFTGESENLNTVSSTASFPSESYSGPSSIAPEPIISNEAFVIEDNSSTMLSTSWTPSDYPTSEPIIIEVDGFTFYAYNGTSFTDGDDITIGGKSYIFSSTAYYGQDEAGNPTPINIPSGYLVLTDENGIIVGNLGEGIEAFQMPLNGECFVWILILIVYAIVVVKRELKNKKGTFAL